MSDRSYDYECLFCGNVDTHLVPFESRHNKQTCSVCRGKSKWLFPVEAALGYQPFSEYYDESLGVDIHSRREKRKILRDKGVIESGDPVHGARNFDKHAPYHVKALPPKGIFYQGKEQPRPKMDISIEDKDGKFHKIKESELKSI